MQKSGLFKAVRICIYQYLQTLLLELAVVFFHHFFEDGDRFFTGFRIDAVAQAHKGFGAEAGAGYDEHVVFFCTFGEGFAVSVRRFNKEVESTCRFSNLVADFG